MKKSFKLYLFSCLILFLSCKKEWLDLKPRDSQVIPASISDAQALLDDNQTLNQIYSTAEISSDDYELDYATWLSLPLPVFKNTYIWNTNIWEGQSQSDWNSFYRKIFVSNVALEALNKIEPTNANRSFYNLAKGHALFLRGNTNYDIAMLFSKPFSHTGSNVEMGIPLRLESDVNEPSIRSTVQETYDQIIKDIRSSITLLPNVPLYTTRPSKPAAYSLLARIFLIKGEYSNAEKYADSCLIIKNTLLDFNSLSLTSTTPINRENPETIYYCGLENVRNLLVANLIVPSKIYQMYNQNDLRRDIYFYTLNGKLTRKSSYTGTISAFGGLAIDEVYLIRAEARARLGRTAEAMTDLNKLLIKRFKTGTFTALSAASPDDALIMILNERRKELIYRGLRWADLRRLNQDSRFAVTLTRILNGSTYTLPPNDKRYTFAIPEVEIRTYGMPQNER